jgi:hypothetical protein
VAENVPSKQEALSTKKLKKKRTENINRTTDLFNLLFITIQRREKKNKTNA